MITLMDTKKNNIEKKANDNDNGNDNNLFDIV